MATSNDQSSILQIATNAIAEHHRDANYLNLMEYTTYPHFTWLNGLSDTNARQDHDYDLDNEINPLFRHAAWRDYHYDNTTPQRIDDKVYDDPQYDIELELYERLGPALRLATKLLERAAPIFVRILFGTVHRYYDDRPQLDMLWIPTEENYRCLREQLHALQSDLRFFWIAKEDQPEGTVWGLCKWVRCYDASGERQPEGSTRGLLHIGINSLLLGRVNRSAWLTNTEIHNASTSFIIATTLVHELAHALWQVRNLNGKSDFTQWREPYVWSQLHRELGFSIEQWLFGFSPQFSIYRDSDGVWRCDGGAGISASVERSLDTADTHIVSFSSIFAMFDRRTWETGLPISISMFKPESESEHDLILNQRYWNLHAERLRLQFEFNAQYPGRKRSLTPSPEVQRSGWRRLRERRL